MSTHNIGFYEDSTKIIFELSSNIIKYAPYFFCWDIQSCTTVHCLASQGSAELCTTVILGTGGPQICVGCLRLPF